MSEAAKRGHFAILQEISVCMGMRGGPERTRTACQPRSRYRTDLRPVANRLVCNPALESQHFGSYRRTIGTSIPVDGDIGNHTFVDPQKGLAISCKRSGSIGNSGRLGAL
jgi:hypothetical protein